MADSPLEDIEAEAQRVLDAADEWAGVVRILGGIAIAMLARRPIPEPFRRSYADIDIMVNRSAGGIATTFLESLGYEPNQRFNNLHGSRRLLFYDTAHDRQLDVFVGAFKMSHELNMEGRLDAVSRTLAPADLLLTKLQIFEVNAKDLGDAATLIYECEVGDIDAPTTISLKRLIDVTSKDWGWYTTFTDNLAATAGLTREKLTAEEAQTVTDRIDTIRTALEEAPKSMGWKLRSRVGRRIPWYEVPEEVDR